MQQEPVEEMVPVQLECGLVWFQAVEVHVASDILYFYLQLPFQLSIALL